ncbi:chitin synthase-domain-containing protein [Yarrowia lipolytica]|uniref:chitin synthase n=2 Tax=Yarrowia lipolytica TaxID=4952 RepID=Q6C012_YARLI|nr:YALI0F28655p [Yarrowia lipolytica CLIB122]AOW07845.1 hypothetical protein YALI1_F36415g [Yarrowia lipolytica]KAB8285852.1 chitin synthase-domain-containing protein [Yarrowia lipolytica]KAE8168965.1 chitin synthase-domain-containing protein [Yarrowia lipolytica]KAJ8055112.1 chitin synthase-domain-containing protein [Yarrowia lipolytica]RDW23384.1 chitin synthase-domain-containing protein [Yarrowia lipolytica]|eukprot:XP_506000.1 YALI0F28655p [Yarrowia lipolytica CLIB122]
MTANVTDLSQLPPSAMSDVGLASHLAARYHQGMPFATISSRTLVMINTYTPMDEQRKEPLNAFSIQIFNRMVKRGESQLVLFLGESGSGKTEFKNSILFSLLTLSNNPLSTKIKNAEFITSAFTCSKTLTSTQASRAGVVAELQYAADSTLIGASFLDYRLERSRITKVPTAERNFHVFYYLLAGISATEREYLELPDPSESRSFRYLGHQSQVKSGINDAERFTHLKGSMASLGFSRSDMANMSQILAAVLHLGQIQFKSTGNDGTSGPAVEIANPEELNLVANFLGVRTTVLENAMVYKTVMMRNDRVTLVLDQKGARESADTLARCLYAMLFSWVLEQINVLLSQTSEDDSTGDVKENTLVETSITLVDFPGFNVSPAVPTLDRLLHNAANEKFYQFVQSIYFENMTDLLESEDIVVPTAEYFDNSDIVRALFKPSLGILSVVDDYSRRDKSDSQLLDSLSKRFSKSTVVESPSSPRSFLVRHFAGEVEYGTDHLLADNAESISGDTVAVFTSDSTSPFLRQLFHTGAVHADASKDFGGEYVQASLNSQPARQPSLVRKSTRRKDANGGRRKQKARNDACGQFVSSVEALTDAFEEANPYFVICLKPNDRRIAGQFDARCVRQQIKCFGITEFTQRVKTTDVGMFIPFARFIALAKNEEQIYDDDTFEGGEDRVVSAQIVGHHGWKERDARIGLTGVFLSERAWKNMVDPSHATEHAMEDVLNRDMGLTPEDAFYYDQDGNPVVGQTGDMFRYNANGELQAKEVGEAEDDVVENVAVTGKRKFWMFIVWTLTWWVPDAAIKYIGRMKRKDVRIAWREKFAINLLIWLACGGVVLFLVGFPILICPTQHVFSTAELQSHSFDNDPKQAFTSIRGNVFDLTKFAPGHYPPIVSSSAVLKYAGKDASDIFPVQISAVCNGINGPIDDMLVMGSTNNYTDENAQYHDFRSFQNDSRPDWYMEQMKNLRINFFKGYNGITSKHIKEQAGKQRTIAYLHNNVYDLTQYVTGDMRVRAKSGESVNKDVDTQFLASEVVNLFQTYSGQDITKKWDNMQLDGNGKLDMKDCLDNLFFVGKLDTRHSVQCEFARYFLLAISIFLVAVIAFKFIAALQFSKPKKPEDLDKFYICQIPAYTEDEESLRRAIDSLARSKYDDKRKLLFVVCDGMIVGAGNDRPTPRIVLDILGVPPEVDAQALSFESLGEGNKQHNMGKVFSGLYEVGGHIVPFVVVVKVGRPTEVNRPGNRGKRDSQMVVMRFLNRVHYGLPMNPLELELYHQIQNVIGVNPAYYEYLFQVDADTQVAPDAATRMISAFLHDTRIIALCGETSLSNAKSTIVTMVQVYEYYISHNMAKAFESLFGSVTCLPGCFSMYKIVELDTGKPLFVSNAIVHNYMINRVDTLHLKNLLHLGEDRYLTTLLLKHFPMYKTKFIREAEAWTFAPDTWSVFLSQRRRWINSTVHNLMELVPMQQLCGFCCFSMRFVVLLDLMSTIVQPVLVGYIVYLIYRLASDPNNIPIASIALLGAIYGLQAIIFLMRRRWEMIGWMFIYILAIPIFSLAIPLYSFWHMDDFSWGNTRVVLGEKGKKMILSSEGKFDPAEIPMQRWEDYQAENWEEDDLHDHEQYDRRSNFDQMSSYDAYHDSPFMDEVSMHQNESKVGLLSTPDPAPVMSHNLPSNEEITEGVRDILRTADLMSVTKKSIRRSLEERFGCSLTPKRDYINFVVEAILSGEL